MSLKVSPQVGLVSEGAGTFSAGEWFLSRVSAEMSLEEPGPREGLAAVLALAGQSVGPDVHLEGALGVVSLVAVFTSDVTLYLV